MLRRRYDRRIDTSVSFSDELSLGSVLLSPGEPRDSAMEPCDADFVLQAV